MSKINSFKDLIVWQKSMYLVRLIYQVTKDFPKSELYGIISQMRRCAISIPSNIAEGYGRNSKKEYVQFYSIAYGSILELETQLILVRDLGYITEEKFMQAEELIHEVSKMIRV